MATPSTAAGFFAFPRPELCYAVAMEKSEWQGQTGDTWAAEWKRTDRSFTQLTEQLLARTREHAFRHVLDIGCGAGELSLALARNNPDATVTGVDVSPALVAVAKDRGAQLPNLSFACADAGKWSGAADAAPDLLVSRHGVMFFPDPPAAFANLAAQSAQGARLLFSCFRAIGENPFFTEVMRLIPDPPAPGDPAAPGPFAFADKARVADILRRGGWTDIAVDAIDFPMIAGAGGNAVDEAVAYFSKIGPAARLAAEMELGSRERFLDRVRALAERHHHADIVALPAAAWIFTARKA